MINVSHIISHPATEGNQQEDGTSFSTMLVPVLVSRSSILLKVKGVKSLVSTSFIARFKDGSEKVLNLTRWTNTSLLISSDLGDSVLSSKDCTLYFKDWANNPIFGEFDKDYPSQIINSTLTA